MTRQADRPEPGRRIDTSVPHSARIWNHWLGGTDNYPVDREAGDAYAATFPAVRDVARASRGFLARGVRYLVREAGMNQFLDVGTGLPTVDNTHQVAQRHDPGARVVYVDHDPLVLMHSEALLSSTPEGATQYVEADLHDPHHILAAAGDLLDLDRPVALVLSDVLGHVPNDAEAQAAVDQLLAGLPPGSYMLLSHAVVSAGASVAQQEYDDTGAVPYKLRTPEQVRTLFAGLDLVEPGVVPLTEWRPDSAMPATFDGVGWGGIGRLR
ncbi:SAM-dependent methyltransferase [Streptomyces lonarensis]|uniref:SAM-dependent methyltransferase n=1 Tax=Streptomyces lonarensis TaxID=700599 RepID=A0A7X6CX44_9ACTN|nr:SAM-dependent methyltransferase [Streptomyces lonarensis]NJQ04013.1 SAM-dependent methyltransferase [Streptomyces lonarensis]